MDYHGKLYQILTRDISLSLMDYLTIQKGETKKLEINGSIVIWCFTKYQLIESIADKTSWDLSTSSLLS